ncbi:MAG: hypothetical protein HGA23_11005, partial [Bacteroidales bacterium]|nr:hypothetical protein [Bacteroidales bacterium]
MQTINKIGFLLFFFLFMAACNPEKDAMDPVIVFIEPEELAVFMLPDTMEVRVHITDNYSISSVMLNLVDQNKITVVQGMRYYPNTNDVILEHSLILDDKSLETGSYYLQVVADDGTNTKFKYREILIQEIPPEILGYMAVTAPLSFKSTLVRMNPGFETIETLDIPETHWLSAAHGLWEQFYFISDEPSVLTAYNPFSFEIEWEVAASPPRALFTAIISDNDLLFSTANGDVGVISNDGTITLRTAAY